MVQGRGMTQKRLKKAIKSAQYNLQNYSDGYRMDYRGFGFAGYRPNWKRDVHCFSTVCGGKSITIRPRKEAKVEMTRKEFYKLQEIVSGLHVECEKIKLTYEPFTIHIPPGNGYCNNFAMVIWRLSWLSPKSLPILLHAYSKGFTPLQSVLIMLYHRSVWDNNQYGWFILNRGVRYKFGLEEMLKKMHLIQNTGNYSMRANVVLPAGLNDTGFLVPRIATFSYTKTAYKNILKRMRGEMADV